MSTPPTPPSGSPDPSDPLGEFNPLEPPPGIDPTPGAAVAPPVDPRLLVRQEGLRGYLDEFKRKVRGGELGSLPVVVGLIVIWLVFSLQNGQYFTAANAEFVAYYMTGLGLLATGLVFVLLLGEIDLSVGSVSGLAAAIYAVLSVSHHWNAWLAVIVTLLAGAAIGALQGTIFAKIGVPAFVVTLAGFLFWQGLMLKLLGSTGTINLEPKALNALFSGDSFFMGGAIFGAYLLAIIAVVALGGSLFLEQHRRKAAGVPYRPTSELVARIVLLGIGAFLVAWILNKFKGVPNNLVIFLALLVICDFVLRRTTYGRKVFAVGGGIEAARRAGINVPLVRITVFAISGGFAALGGMFFAGQTASATLNAGGGNTLMLAIAAAVICGTSLFGGRGNVWSALLGMLVIQSIQTGLDLLNMNTSIQYMITGAVLLGAVVIDSVSRRSQKAAGRA